MEESIINSAVEMVTPVMESAMIIAAQYAKACDRNTVTAVDVQYGMRYAAQRVAGKQIGTLFPELQNEDSDDDESDIEEVDEEDEPFTRYSGDNELMNDINTCNDKWEEWEPFSPLEKILKSAIDSSG